MKAVAFVILTRPAIRVAFRLARSRSSRTIPPALSPNAYDWRLGDTLRVCADGCRSSHNGLVLKPGSVFWKTYLFNGDQTIRPRPLWVHPAGQARRCAGRSARHRDPAVTKR
ncbi:hypothetical protein ACRAWF_00575 [Streptomyces sp. L7]